MTINDSKRKRVRIYTPEQLEAKNLRDRERYAAHTPEQREAWKEACRQRYQEKYRAIRVTERKTATHEDREKRREYERERHLKLTKEKKKERSARYAAYKRERRERYLELDKKRRKNWTPEQREAALEKGRRWRRDNPERSIANTHRRRARLRGSDGSYTDKEWMELVERCNHRCVCCLRQEPEIKLTVDHIIPISKGGSNVIGNIQPLCRSCNCSKHDKYVNYLERTAA